MESKNIVSLRSGQSSSRPTPQQRVLFEDPAKSFGYVIFIDITSLSQEKMLKILSMNEVNALIDIRKIPVFRKPKFKHAEIIDYITARKIQYLDFTSEISRNQIGDAMMALLASQPHPLSGQISRALDSGLTVILYEENEDTKLSISGIRNLLKYHSSFRAELHPNALMA